MVTAAVVSSRVDFLAPELEAFPRHHLRAAARLVSGTAEDPSGPITSAMLKEVLIRVAELLRSRQVTSVELTEMYLVRLHRYNDLAEPIEPL